MKYLRSLVLQLHHWSPSMRREWIEMLMLCLSDLRLASPSMRREWIEMVGGTYSNGSDERSPSMRREWIEIASWLSGSDCSLVSLHAEGVD